MSLSSLVDAFDQGEIDQGIKECDTPLVNSRYLILFPFDEGCEGIGGVQSGANDGNHGKDSTSLSQILGCVAN